MSDDIRNYDEEEQPLIRKVAKFQLPEEDNGLTKNIVEIKLRKESGALKATMEDWTISWLDGDGKNPPVTITGVTSLTDQKEVCDKLGLASGAVKKNSNHNGRGFQTTTDYDHVNTVTTLLLMNVLFHKEDYASKYMSVSGNSGSLSSFAHNLMSSTQSDTVTGTDVLNKSTIDLFKNGGGGGGGSNPNVKTKQHQQISIDTKDLVDHEDEPIWRMSSTHHKTQDQSSSSTSNEESHLSNITKDGLDSDASYQNGEPTLKLGADQLTPKKQAKITSPNVRPARKTS